LLIEGSQRERHSATIVTITNAPKMKAVQSGMERRRRMVRKPELDRHGMVLRELKAPIAR
jgi:hypothetical protein